MVTKTLKTIGKVLGLCGVAFMAGALSFGSSDIKAEQVASLNNIIPAAGNVSGVLDRVKQTGKLRCGYIEYPPYLVKDPNTGEMSGLMADVLTELENKINIKIEWTEAVGWGSMIEGLKANRYDSVCTAVWQNTERSFHASFTNAMGFTPVYAWKAADNSDLDDLSDLNEGTKRIAVIDGEMSEKITKARFPNAKVVSYPQMTSFAQIMTDVTNGKADVFFAEKAVAQDFLNQNPGAVVNMAKDEPVMAFPVTFMTSQQAPLLLDVLNAHIQEMQFDGSLAAAAKAHGLDQESFAVKTDL